MKISSPQQLTIILVIIFPILVRSFLSETYKGKILSSPSSPRILMHQEPEGISRKDFGKLLISGAPVALSFILGSPASAETKFEEMPMLKGKDYGKPRTIYPDFTQTPSGLQFKDVKPGEGSGAEVGDRVVIDWEGYTIGFYGRIFQAKNKAQGGAFDQDLDYTRFVLGKGTMIQGLEEGLVGMKKGGVRQIVIPPELGYPPSDPKHERVGPKPTTFSGQRALDFVLENQGMVDKTLLINVSLKRIDKPGERGFPGK
mmetsp:Transcript_11854/g.15503  ORF Transcript_11854/g.15503 Transcript_11854/m.15503 type:complete len:257 (-) Transcript_11854:448-1218(-)|eukprot:CAMPEP_0117753240 /NCGR_PEP_ID=MMETSP0947-20121206/12104_1 /TAXON_ID=44440 /ORGANISM="Chattonella subsalsa, Strain CCMP2191" /LENGTH=256 /DNA_ID=CAMNT_0005572077 /DNA_START=70 /DNA_END=840 /DNA_ORIENTATION=+